MIERNALGASGELGAEEIDTVEGQSGCTISRFGRIKLHCSLISDVDIQIELGHQQGGITFVEAVTCLSEHRLGRPSEMVAFQVVAQTLIVSGQLVVDAGIVVFIGCRRESASLTEQSDTRFRIGAHLSHSDPPVDRPGLELLVAAPARYVVETGHQPAVGPLTLIAQV